MPSDPDDMKHTSSKTADRIRSQSDTAGRPNESPVGPDRNLLSLACSISPVPHACRAT